MITLDKVLEEAELLEFDDREYLLNILSKRQIELRRAEISKRVKETTKAYKEGNVKRGKFEELWKDLNENLYGMISLKNYLKSGAETS